MKRKVDELLPLLLCAAVVLGSLALPFFVFDAGDSVLVKAPHSQTANEDFSAEGRANPTACLLYTCDHVLNLHLGMDIWQDDGWTPIDADETQLARVQNVLQTLHKAGLMRSESYENVLAAMQDTEHYGWRITTAPGGLTQFSLSDTYAAHEETEAEDTCSSCPIYLNVTLSYDDMPLFLNYQNREESWGDAAAQQKLQSYCAALGLDSFADWQVLNWPHSAQSCGAAAYSETAQVYLVVNYDDGITLSAVSMTPKSFAEFNRVFSKENGT